VVPDKYIIILGAIVLAAFPLTYRFSTKSPESGDFKLYLYVSGNAAIAFVSAV